MKRLMVSLLILAATSGTALAEMDELDSLVSGAASLQQSVDSILYRQRVRAVPVPGVRGRCQRVGLIYLDQQGRGGPRIANYDVCGREVTELGDVSPALPDDASSRQVVLSTMKAAALYGRRSLEWQGYGLFSTRLTPPDSYGCAQVETTVTFDGLLVTNSMGRICP